MTHISILKLQENTRPQVKEEDYTEVQPYIDAIRAVAQLTYKSLYIIDYHKKNFLYVSDNPLFLCGESVEEVKKKGAQFYADHISEEDLVFLTQLHQVSSDFFSNISIADKTQYTISYNFYLNDTPTNKKELINHQITPLKLSKDGNIWLALCMVSLAPSQVAGRAYMTSLTSKQTWHYSTKMGCWEECKEIILTKFEQAVIRLSHRGLSVSEIAKEIHRSENSIKGYRKSLYAKLGVNNIVEAIAIATLRRLI